MSHSKKRMSDAKRFRPFIVIVPGKCGQEDIEHGFENFKDAEAFTDYHPDSSLYKCRQTPNGGRVLDFVY